MPSYRELKTAFICVCISRLSKAGLLNASPISFEICEVFTPPNAVSCGVAGSFKKLKTVLPPIVCAGTCVMANNKDMISNNLKALRR